METKHTPGPWIPSIHGFQVVTGDSMHSVCELKNLPEMKENSRLIAAAPELLRALIDLQKEIRSAVKFDVKKHYSLMVAEAAASKAIAKAEGE